ncbi:MAG: TolC family protein [Sulfuricurvum sp.]
MFHKTVSISVCLAIAVSAVSIDGDTTFGYKSRSTIVRKVESIDTQVSKNNSRLLPPPALESAQTRNVPMWNPTLLKAPLTRNGDLHAVLSQPLLTFPRYLEMVTADNTKMIGEDFESRIEMLQNEFLQSRYDFDVSFQSYIGANQLPTATEGLATTLSGRLGIQAKKNLYDGNKRYLNDQKTLYERVSKYKQLSAMENAKLVGAEIYLQLLELQMKGQFLARQQELIDKVYETTMLKIDKGVSDNAYNQTNAQMDKLALDKLRLGLSFDIHKAAVLFKQAANMNADENVTLEWPDIAMQSESVERLQQKAVENSAQVKMADAVLRLRKGEVLSERGSNDWNVFFDSFAGYGYSTSKTDITNRTSTGANWLVSLQASYPLTQNPTDINVQKRMVEALKEKNSLLQLQRGIILRVNTLYTECRRNEQMLELLNVQKEIAERQIKIARFRYEGGLDPYTNYATSVKKLLETEESMLSTRIRQLRDLYELELLSGGETQ